MKGSLIMFLLSRLEGVVDDGVAEVKRHTQADSDESKGNLLLREEGGCTGEGGTEAVLRLVALVVPLGIPLDVHRR